MRDLPGDLGLTMIDDLPETIVSDERDMVTLPDMKEGLSAECPLCGRRP
jgi:hypothetical protein